MANITGNSSTGNSSTSPSNNNFSLPPTTTQHSSKDFAHQMTAELVPVAVIIVFANLLVFVLFCLKSNLRTPTNYFLIGLALADFLTGAVNIPLLLAALYGFRNTGIDLSIWHSFTATLCAYHILVITAEKFFAIMRPLRHHQMSKKSALSITLLVWCCSSFLVFIQLAWGSNSEGEASRLKQTIYVLFTDVVVFIIPYVFMIYAYMTMFRAISRSKEKLLHGQRGTSFARKLKQNRAERKCLIVFALMALVYAICWLPWFTLATLLQLRYPGKLHDALRVFIFMRYLTSAFNPIIYTFFKRDFKVALKSLLFRKSAKAEARETLLKSFRYRRNIGSRGSEIRYSPSGSITMDSVLPLRQSPPRDDKHRTSFLRLQSQADSSSRRNSLPLAERMPTTRLQLRRNSHCTSHTDIGGRHVSFHQNEPLRSCRSEPSIKDAKMYVSSV